MTLNDSGFQFDCSQNAAFDDLSIVPFRELGVNQLVAWNSGISSLDELRGLDMTQLIVGGTELRNLSPLAEMPSLSWLSIQGLTELTDITPLRGLNLTSLHMANTAVTDLSPLRGMTRLTNATIPRTVTNLEILEDLPSLKLVQFEGCGASGPEKTVEEFFADLRGPVPVKEVVLPPDSEWRWLHPLDGRDPATDDLDFHHTFFAADYDDSTWQTGQDSDDPTGGFGYGEVSGMNFDGVDIGIPDGELNNKGKAVRFSAYFRCRFETDEPHHNLELRCRRDDGIIVYLDGKEVARDNVGEGEEAYRLPAVSPVGGAAETTVVRIPLEGVTLEPGEHVLAISLHNTKAPSSDLRIGGITLVELETPE
ncbi:MAG: hypothetical protein GWO24_21590 [Akkermansiaceae bacterium]|nr:hypothetical protein [Akkermansiaceae bacterium]